MTTLKVERTPDGRRLWRQWVLANSLGFVVSGAAGGGIARAMSQPFFGGRVTSPVEGARILAVNTAVALAVWGAGIGILQWLVLRELLKRAGWWIPATIGGWSIAGAVSGALSGAIGGAVTTIGGDIGPIGFIIVAVVGILAVGFLPGAFQWLVLRRQVEGAGRWVSATAAGFALAGVAGFTVVRGGLVMVGLLRPEDFPSAAAFVAFGAVMGPVYGAVTGNVLARLLRLAPRETPGAV